LYFLGVFESELKKQKAHEIERELEKERKSAQSRFAANSAAFSAEGSIPMSPIIPAPTSPFQGYDFSYYRCYLQWLLCCFIY
jgi:hypothetical protein